MRKNLFDQAMGEVPPSTVDVDAVIARERRAAWVRRVANPWVATAAGVVAVTLGIAMATLPGAPEEVGGAGPPSTTSSKAPVLPPGPRCAGATPTARPAPELPAAAAARLTGVLTAAVQRHLAPGARLLPQPATQNPPRPEFAPLEFVHESSPLVETEGGGCQGGSDEFLAGARVVRSGQTGSIEAVVARLGGHASPSDRCDNGIVEGYDVTCTPQTGPDGEVIIATVMTPQRPGSTVHRVDVTKPDGTGVILLAADSADAKRADGPTSSAPPLTHEQLIDIVLDPGMTLYPR